MTFYEQIFPDGRTVIHSMVEPNSYALREIDANCWIEAKKFLGYFLTNTQEWLLREFYEERERAARRAAGIV